MKNILYSFLGHKKINGTLFYCFEYYVFLKERDDRVFFNIYNISNEDLDLVKATFKERYSFNLEYLDDIRPVNSIMELYRKNYQLTLILDMDTFEKTYPFIRNDILCFSHKNHQKIRSKEKKITYYGHYEYQDFDIKNRLKFNFDKYLIPSSCEKGLLVSCLNDSIEIPIPEQLKNKNVIRKKFNKSYRNFFGLFDTLFYYHVKLDTNNRLIPECFFYNKEIVLDGNNLGRDSVRISYEDIKENGLSGYRLSEGDLMVNDFLNY